MNLISSDGLLYLDEQGKEHVITQMADEMLLQAITHRRQQLQALVDRERLIQLEFSPPHTLQEWESELRRTLRALIGEIGVRSPGGDPRRPRRIGQPGGLGE